MQEEKEKRKKARTVVALAGILIVIYILALFFIPNHILEYRLYYIQGCLTEWPGYGGLNYKLGDVVFLDKEHIEGTSLRKGKGWSSREENGSWTVGEKAEILYIIKEERNLTLTMDIEGMLCDGFEVLVNGEYVGDSSEIVENRLVLDIPSTYYRTGELIEIELMIKKPVRPCDISDSLDERELGVQVKSVLLERK